MEWVDNNKNTGITFNQIMDVLHQTERERVNFYVSVYILILFCYLTDTLRDVTNTSIASFSWRRTTNTHNNDTSLIIN